jgi:UDP-N-acetylmuramoylalanine--D-glutamate ligase
MKIAILGYGEQGRAAYDYWGRDTANQLTICDRNETLVAPEGALTRLGPSYLKDLDQFDVLVRAPGLHPRDIAAANSDAILTKVTTVTNEFLRVCPSFNIIGVTGTKGKGTTSTLITRMLEAAGKTVHLGGNIGTPPLDLLNNKIQPDDWVVLELANFQLIDLHKSPHIAVCLLVVPEHLDWHADLQEYITSKQQLFATQTSSDIAIYYADNENSKTVASAGQAAKIPYFAPPGAMVVDEYIAIDGQKICRIDEIKLLGKHNWQNVCAALTAVWQVTHDVAALHKAIAAFEGLPHRLEPVRIVDQVRFYNDSFAATPEAAIAALEAISGTKVLIVGGFDRQLPLQSLANGLAEAAADLRKVVLIGQSRPRVAQALASAGYDNFVLSSAATMTEIVSEARHYAKSGDAVLLSPGFPSFDMFKNFEDRGLQFKAVVTNL